MIQIRIGELSPPTGFRITQEQGRLLARSGVVRASPSSFESGTWLVSPAGKVGAARVGDMEVRIDPKVPVTRLLFLVGYAQHRAAWREETVPLTQTAELVPVLGQALWRQVRRAIHQGLLPGYVVTEETSYVLRGRLRETEQSCRRPGLAIPLEIQHDDFTVDIPENRILRTACERILLAPGLDAESARMLRRLLRDFADVTPLTRGDSTPAWQPTRLNARYHTALRLAELVLAGTSIESGSGGIAVNGFLIDMPKLFEDFVTIALREALISSVGGRVVAQDRHHLDEGTRVMLRPDIVWKLRGKPVAVIDAKYKAESPAGYPNADLYQMLAYCTVLGLPRGHLVYAKGNEEPARHVVRRSGIEIICHSLDLDSEPGALLVQVMALTTELQPALLPPRLW